jgi:RHS repeat-associated protein
LTKSSGDANGNLTNDGKFDYQYDSQNRLLSVTSVLSAVNSVRAEFFYDARNRCVLRKYYIKGSQGQWVLNTTDSRALAYDANWNLLAERTLDGKQVGEYILGSRTDEILSAQLGSKTYYPLADGLGSTVALTDKNGAVAERYRTTAFGTPTVLAANYQPRSAANATGYRFLFTGREWLSQVGLNDHRNRYYSPGLGRWLTSDRLVNALLLQGANLYWYAQNEPTNQIDPDGLATQDFTYTDGVFDDTNLISHLVGHVENRIKNRTWASNGNPAAVLLYSGVCTDQTYNTIVSVKSSNGWGAYYSPGTHSAYINVETRAAVAADALPFTDAILNSLTSLIATCADCSGH